MTALVNQLQKNPSRRRVVNPIWRIENCHGAAHNLLHIYRLSCPLPFEMLLNAAGSKNCVVSVNYTAKALC